MGPDEFVRTAFVAVMYGLVAVLTTLLFTSFIALTALVSASDAAELVSEAFPDEFELCWQPAANKTTTADKIDVAIFVIFTRHLS